MSRFTERIVWLLVLAMAIGVSVSFGHRIAQHKCQREAVGNLNQVPMIVTKALWTYREHPNKLPQLLETTLDSYSISVWELGQGMPEVTNTLMFVKDYRVAHSEYSPDPDSEEGQRFRRTQEILTALK